MGIGPKPELPAFPPPRRPSPVSPYRKTPVARVAVGDLASMSSTSSMRATRPRRVVATRPDPSAQMGPASTAAMRAGPGAWESRNAQIGRALGYGWSVGLGASFFVWKLVLVPMIGRAVAFVFEHHRAL